MWEISPDEKAITLSSLVSGFIIWVLSSFAFIVYLNYVGLIGISGYLIFKVMLVCLAAPIILLVYDRMQKVRMENKYLLAEKKKTQFSKSQEDNLNLSIDFNSGVNSGKLNFLLKEMLFIKSANNYVEIYYLNDDQIKKKLVRSTLASIELLIESYPTLIRCHRTCIVNTQFVGKLNSVCNNHTLTINGYNRQIPVSRRYYLKVKEAV